MDMDLDPDMDDLEDKDLDTMINGAKRERIHELSRSTDSKDSNNVSFVRRSSSVGINNIGRFADHSKFNFSGQGATASPYRTVTQNHAILPANILNELGSPMRLNDVGVPSKELDKFLQMDCQPRLRQVHIDLTLNKHSNSQKSGLRVADNQTNNAFPSLKSLLEMHPPRLPNFNTSKPSQRLHFTIDEDTVGDQSLPVNGRETQAGGSGKKPSHMFSKKRSFDDNFALNMSIMHSKDDDDKKDISYMHGNSDDPQERSGDYGSDGSANDLNYIDSVIELTQEYQLQRADSDPEEKGEKGLKEAMQKSTQQKYHKAGQPSPKGRSSIKLSETDLIV